MKDVNKKTEETPMTRTCISNYKVSGNFENLYHLLYKINGN